jgi:hypothetical protein
MEKRFQTGTVVSAIGHAGVILWVLVGDWLFSPDPAPETLVMNVSTMTSAEFAELQAATATPAEETAPVRPQARPEELAEAEPEPEPAPEPEPEPVPEPEPEPVVEPPPSDVTQADEEQLLPSESTEIQPVPEAEEIIAPDPVQPETEAETSDTPEPAVTEDPAADEVIEQEPTEETVAEDTGDVTQTEANELQEAETGMTTSPRPRSRPEPAPEPEVEVAAAEPEEAPEEPVEEPAEEPAEQPVDDQATEDVIADLLGEAVEEPVDEPAEEPAETGGQELPQGPPLSGSEMGNISSAIARKWNVGSLSTEAMNTVVVVRVSFAEDGKPLDFQLIESNGPTQTGIDKLYESARRAVNRAYADGGLPLPAEKFNTWRVLDLVFDANGMRLR